MMVRSAFVKWLSLTAICFHILSCQVMEEVEESSDGETWLKVETRSSEIGPVLYPLSVYAFDEGGKCHASQTVANASDPMELVLPTGKYQIVAVAGHSEDYRIPEEPSLGDVINLEGTADVPLMMGAKNIEIDGEENVSMEIALSYVVAGLNVLLKNIPSDVTAVSFGLSPLYSSLSFAGEYGGASSTVVASCFLSEEDEWKSDSLYIFPGKATETLFSIVFEKKDGSKNKYEYVCSKSPESGRFFNLTGIYHEGVSVTGNIIGGNWDGSDDVSFDFGMVGQSDDEDSGMDIVELPEIGTIWNGAIVADVCENDSTGTEILLLSLEEWDAMTVQVDDIMNGYSVNGMMGWRLPSHGEAQMFRDRFCGENRLALNNLISEYDPDLCWIDGEERYLCDKDGEFYSFVFSAGKPISQAGTQRSYYVRLVKVYNIGYSRLFG